MEEKVITKGTFVKKIIAVLFVVVGLVSIGCGIVVLCTGDSSIGTSNPSSKSFSYFSPENESEIIAYNSGVGVNVLNDISHHLYYGNWTNAKGFSSVLVIFGSVLILNGISRYIDEKQR